MVWSKSIERLRCPVCGAQAPLRVEAALAKSAKGELLEGVLRCGACPRWFRVERGVADLVRDELREVADERVFLRKYEAQLPEGFVRSAQPVALDQSRPEPNEADARIIAEGRHWGRFMRRFWDVGDRSIFDIRIKGTHPRYYLAGILERDDRDVTRRFSFFPPRVGAVLFTQLGEFRDRWGVDVGCGGGQMGLEAAYQGVQMIGLDPAFEALALARQHAREQKIETIDYVRGEPSNPPLADGGFALLMAKDSLHHVPDLPRAMERVVALGEPGATLIVHEHIARADLKEAVMNRLRPRAIAKIRRRYPSIDIPGELLRDSANEDVSAHLVRAEVLRHCRVSEEANCLFLAEELEALAYYAFGKRRWFARLVRVAGAVMESALLMAGNRQHWSARGRLEH